VLNLLFALSRKAEFAPSYKGPILELDGTITRSKAKSPAKGKPPSQDAKSPGKVAKAPPAAERDTCTCSLL
jgi:hypothetical protein